MLRTTCSLIVVGLLAPLVAEAQPRCEPPRALLVVDKSSSMTNLLPSDITKWDAARMAIGDVTSSFAEGIDFGLQVFPYPDRCEPGIVTVQVGRNSSSTILDALGDAPPTTGNFTPMAETLEVSANYAPLTDGTRDSHVILITDGWQWCSPYDPAIRFTPVSVIEDLHSQGITVHVVGFGAGVDTLTLNRAAVAGGTARPGCDPDGSSPSDPNVCYHQADDLSGLRIALDNISTSITDEVCDGFDNDCDASVDEGFDMDADGYTVCGTVDGSPGVTSPDRVDCDDTDANVHPNAAEACDGVDNDCDGRIDPNCGCQPGDEQPCGLDVGACLPGTQRCESGGWGECIGATEPALGEVCDGTDEDCDGRVDEGALCGSGRSCMDGQCIELMPPPSPGPDPDAEPEPETEPPAAMPPLGSQDGGCCATVPVSRRGSAPLALGLALVLGLVVGRRRRL